jgi:hypothetical protein
LNAEDLIQILKQHPQEEVKVLSNSSFPLKIETAYYDKDDNRYIIETN